MLTLRKNSLKYKDENGVMQDSGVLFASDEEKNYATKEELEQLSEEIADQQKEIVTIIGKMPEEMRGGIREYAVEWENGVIDNINGNESESDKRIRSDYIQVGESARGDLIDETVDVQYWIRAYDAEKNFIGNAQVSSTTESMVIDTKAFKRPVVVDNVLTIYPNAGYIRLVAKVGANGSQNITPEMCNISFVKDYGNELNSVPFDDVYQRIATKGEYTNNDLTFMYDIGNGYQTKGFLKLPPNYLRNGKPVPLIVFVHGSSDIGSIDVDAMTTLYNDYYNFLRDSGYAVFDCYTYGTKYTRTSGGYSNTWGIPINKQCYLSGIEYVCTNYNIDKNNVFVTCKSLGGIQAINMFYDESLPIKAVGMLAPELNPFNVFMGYSEANKRTIATELNFSDDVNNVLAFNQNEEVPEGFWDYITDNMDKWIGHFSIFCGLPISGTEKPNYYRNIKATSNMCRTSLNRPVKIWIAQDDTIVSYSDSNAFIQSLNNGGYKGELRTMPNGTGGHHAVDNDVNALQTIDVTTKCGVAYETVPTAYYELVQFFDKYCIN